MLTMPSARIKYIMLGIGGVFLSSRTFLAFNILKPGRTDRIDDFRFLCEWRDDDVTAPDFHLDEELSTIL